jgi:hypothetical protein
MQTLGNFEEFATARLADQSCVLRKVHAGNADSQTDASVHGTHATAGARCACSTTFRRSVLRRLTRLGRSPACTPPPCTPQRHRRLRWRCPARS